MTTNDSSTEQNKGANEATANDDISNQAKDAVKEAVQSSDSSYLTKEEAKSVFEEMATERKAVFDQAQGRAQNVTQQKIKEVQDKAENEINTVVQDFEDLLDEDTKEVFRQRRAQRKAEEQQAEMQEGLELLREFKQVADNAPNSALSQEQLVSLEATISNVAKNLGANVTARDQSVWKGWNAQMGYDESVALATKNISELQVAKPTNKPNTTSNVPPTTQGAPSTAKKMYNSQVDLARAFSKGEINVQTFNKLKKEI